MLATSAAPATATVHDGAPSSAPISLSDGARAETSDHCGDGDLCAFIAYPNGDVLRIYSEGATSAQPYILNFVRTSNGQIAYQYARQIDNLYVNPTSGKVKPTRFLFDHGNVSLSVDEYTDGTLRFIFAKTGS